jgi:2-alkyl-3-oxoalkanoate reductase
MPSALVTGATGLIGSHIVERLLADGWTVRALVRTPSPWLDSLGVESMVGDVLEPEGFARAAMMRDVIFHTAAAITTRGGWETFRRLNVDGTQNAINAAERSGARLLQLSSVAVYGPSGRYRDAAQKTDEEVELGPLPERAFYARSKRESEALVLGAHRAGRIWATAVRPDVVYGRRDRQFVPRIARILRLGFAPVIAGGRTTLPVVHAANVADGAVRAVAVAHAGGRAYNLANDFDVTARDFFTLAGHGLERRVRLVSISKPVARSLFRAAMLVLRTVTGGQVSVASSGSLDFLSRDNPFSSERARRELGWSPTVRPEEGIPDAFRWWLSASRGAATLRKEAT